MKSRDYILQNGAAALNSSERRLIPLSRFPSWDRPEQFHAETTLQPHSVFIIVLVYKQIVYSSSILGCKCTQMMFSFADGEERINYAKERVKKQGANAINYPITARLSLPTCLCADTTLLSL